MRYVRYIGLAHHRQISAAEFRQAGAPGETVVWNAFNGFAVPLDTFTEDQIRKAIQVDDSFVITGEGDDEKFEPDTSARRDMTPQEMESRRVDILDPTDTENVSTPGSETSTATPAGKGGTGRGASGHDKN